MIQFHRIYMILDDIRLEEVSSHREIEGIQCQPLRETLVTRPSLVCNLRESAIAAWIAAR
jgi:hypothetical protein